MKQNNQDKVREVIHAFIGLGWGIAYTDVLIHIDRVVDYNGRTKYWAYPEARPGGTYRDMFGVEAETEDAALNELLSNLEAYRKQDQQQQ